MSSMRLKDNPQSDFLYAGFNQDYGCFTVGTKSGFRVYNTSPVKEVFRRDLSCKPLGGIGIVAMLYRCNILALVGGGNYPRWPPDTVVLWDDREARIFAQLTFSSPVLAVRLERGVILVVLLTRMCIYSSKDLILMDAIETYPNPFGISSLIFGPEAFTVAAPGLFKGGVNILKYDHPALWTSYISAPENEEKPKRKSAARERTSGLISNVFIEAHDTCIAQLTMNLHGNLLATASIKGTLIRVFDTQTGATLFEFRRGFDRTLVYSLAFSHDSHCLAAASSKGTIHIFLLGERKLVVSRPSRRYYRSRSHSGTIQTIIGKPLQATTSSKSQPSSPKSRYISFSSSPLSLDPVSTPSMSFASSAISLVGASPRAMETVDKGESLSTTSVHSDFDSVNHDDSSSLKSPLSAKANNPSSKLKMPMSPQDPHQSNRRVRLPNEASLKSSLSSQRTSNQASKKSSFLAKMFKSFSPIKSFLQFKIPCESCPCICAFGTDFTSLFVVCADGSFYFVKIDPVGFQANGKTSQSRVDTVKVCPIETARS